VVLQRKKYTSDAEDVERTHFTNVITNVQVVDSQRPKEENIHGLNGIHRCKKLPLFLVH
jgi:hypothetical protein